jgi:hypothetical protein
MEVKTLAEHTNGHGPDTPDIAAPQRPQEHAPVPPEPTGEVKKVDLPLTRVLSRGDYISRIAVEVYGSASDDILALIKRHNPQIKDINRVEVGEKVLFPAVQVATP